MTGHDPKSLLEGFGARVRARFSPWPDHPIPRSPFRTLGQSLRLIWNADPKRATLYLLIATAQGLLPVATAWLAKLVLDRAGAALLQRGDASLAADAFAVAVWYAGLRFAGHVIEPIGDQAKANLDVKVTGHIERRLMDVGAAIPDLDHFERKAFQDEIDLLTREASWQPKNLTTDLRLLARSALTLLGSLALIWRFQPFLAVALLLGAMPQALLERRRLPRLYAAITARSQKARMMHYCATLTTEPAAAKELLVFGLGPWFYARWRQLAGEALAEMARVRREGLLGDIAIVGLNGGVLAVGYAYIAAQIGSHRLTIGDFALYLSVVTGMQQTLFSLTRAIGNLQGNLLFLGRLFAFFYNTKPSIAVTPPEQALPVPARLREGIELRDVHFTYPGRSGPVLRGVSCLLRAGETVALVGENGAGKTTLVKLLTRLYDPTAGAILLDGRPLAAYDLAALRARGAALFQDFARFALSAQHNIGVGDAGHADDRDRVQAAARWAGADAVLARLPQGPDTPLTRAFEGGVELSGGEWQQVATARAAMRDAALVILDEPTAALDAQAERELFARFRELAAGRTVLLISHRFSTVRLADRILVLEDGRIVEAGSHAELVARGGRYAALYELQAGRYR